MKRFLLIQKGTHTHTQKDKTFSPFNSEHEEPNFFFATEIVSVKQEG